MGPAAAGSSLTIWPTMEDLLTGGYRVWVVGPDDDPALLWAEADPAAAGTAVTRVDVSGRETVPLTLSSGEEDAPEPEGTYAVGLLGWKDELIGAPPPPVPPTVPPPGPRVRGPRLRHGADCAALHETEVTPLESCEGVYEPAQPYLEPIEGAEVVGAERSGCGWSWMWRAI